jgi:preprotein translocase subunit SecD
MDPNMLNRYPFWKNALIIVVLIVGFIYAVPNFFGEDPALQISATKQAAIDDSVQQKVATVLTDANIPFTVERHSGSLLFRFNNTPQQLQAKEQLSTTLSNDYVIALNLAPAVPSFFRWFAATPMKLGLDLRGGVHFLLQVDVDSAIKRHVNGFVDGIKSRFREQKIHYRNVSVSGEKLDFRFDSQADQDEALALLHQEFPAILITAEKGGQAESFPLSGELTPMEWKTVLDNAIEQSINTLRNRVNELGVAEAVVQRQGQDRIVVELPGVQDTAYAKEILGTTASLEFRMVNYQADPNLYLNSRPPAGTVMFKDREGRPHLFDRQVVLSGENIVGAQSGFDEMGKPAVFIQLGGDIRQFSRITGENIGNGMATIFVETRYTTQEINGKKVRVPETRNEVISIANITTRLGNRFQITNMESATEARNLSLLLRAGALPAPIDIIEERIIGPSMGEDNIKKGIISLVVGLSLIMVFMAVYYNLFGLIANMGLLLNLLMLLSFLSVIGATLTLPAIAAIVLTLGMAVDANVLIFERIREEMRLGHTVQASIAAGFDRAFVTILDANLTTFIAALALFSIGSGPIKGFALALILGLITSVFTAVPVTRMLVNIIFGGRNLKKLPIGI